MISCADCFEETPLLSIHKVTNSLSISSIKDLRLFFESTVDDDILLQALASQLRGLLLF